jgi:hypothetical protein
MVQGCGTTRRWQLFSNLIQGQTPHLRWALRPITQRICFISLRREKKKKKKKNKQANLHQRSELDDRQELHAIC